VTRLKLPPLTFKTLKADHNPESAENLHISASLGLYSRLRFTTNLLPLLRKSTSIKRAISVPAIDASEISH
jgi:hypothetical protein